MPIRTAASHSPARPQIPVRIVRWLIALSLVTIASAHAATLTVTSTADSGAGSLRATISGSVSGDVIVFDAALDGAVIALSSFSNPATGRQFGPSAFFITAGKVLTIDATGNGLTHGVTLTRSGSSNFRLFDVDSDSTLTLRGLVLQNGAAVGGGYRFGGGALGAGGAIFNRGVLDIERCTLTGNRAQGGSTGNPGAGPRGGGGVATTFISFGLIGGNPNGGGFGGGPPPPGPPYDGGPGGAGGFGGGGGAGGSGLSSSDGYLGYGGDGGNGGFGGGGGSGGYGMYGRGKGGVGGFGGGGGAAFNNGVALALGGFGGGKAPLFESGAGAGLGGAIFNDSGSVALRHSTFSANTAQGGSNSLAPAGDGSGYGGAIFNYNGTLTVEFVTLSNNSVAAGSSGGGSSDGGAIYTLGDSNAACGAGGNSCTSNGATLTMRYSIASGSTGGTSGTTNDVVDSAINGGAHSVDNTGNWIRKWSGSPAVLPDPLLGPLAANQGFGMTLLPLAGSPVIDALPPACPADGASIDQRGFVRPQGSTCDLGAVEVRQTALDVTVTGSGTVTANALPAPASGGIANCDATGTTACSAYYRSEDSPPTVTLVATPTTASSFIGWSGDCNGSDNPLTLSLGIARHCVATFAADVTVTASVTGGHGTITPLTQTLVSGGTVALTLTPDSGCHLAAVAGTCGGHLDGTTYTTLPVTQNCAVEASFAIDPAAVLNISACKLREADCTSADDYAQYGTPQTYVVTAQNTGDATASDVTVVAGSPDLNENATSWLCTNGGSGICQSSGAGALTNNNVTLPAGGSLSWIVTTSVRTDAPNSRMEYLSTLSRTSDPTPHSAILSTTLVVFRDGFDGPAVARRVASMGTWTGEQPITLAVPSTPGPFPALAFSAHASDDSGFRIESLSFGAQRWLRVVVFNPREDERSGRWSPLAGNARVALAIVGDARLMRVLMLGAAEEISLPVSSAARWTISAAKPTAAEPPTDLARKTDR